MLRTLFPELMKTKRRGIWLVMAALLSILTLWMAYAADDEKHLSHGWMMLLYDAPLLNGIMVPTFMAVYASRLIDMEHKGNMWKLLETMQSKSSIYLSKLLYGFAGVLLFSVLQLSAFAALGCLYGFANKPDLWAYGLYFITTFAITFNIFMLQLNISAIFQNQAVALCTGLCGSMAGLFLMFMPQWPLLRNLIPWGNYGAAMFVGMDWDKETKTYTFYYMDQHNGALFFIAGWMIVLLAGGWSLFKHMDTDGGIFHRKRNGSTEEISPEAYPIAIPGSQARHKPVKLPRIPTELIKIKRTPIWLAFIILPLISALIGTFNYMNNLEILKSSWHSLWTQHSLFFCYFFMPPLIGVYASYLWRLEHNGTNWNMVLVTVSPARLVFQKICVCTVMAFLTLAWLALLFIVCGRFAGITAPLPPELLEWLACGLLGGLAVCAIQCFLSLAIRSFAIPIGIALAGGVAGLLLTAAGYFYILPYSLLSIGMRANNPSRELDTVEFLSSSVLFILLFFTLSVQYLRHHDVKTQG